MGEAIVGGSDFIGTFTIDNGSEIAHLVDAWSNVIESDDGVPAFRLVALIARRSQSDLEREELEQRIRDKDTLLRELQHRVKNISR